MKPKIVHNIFSQEKIINKKEKPKCKIIIDYREKNCLVPAHLKKVGFNIEFKELKVADYIVKDIAIERKTVSDFLSSMINNHLSNQLHEMQQYPRKILIVEGLEHQELYSTKQSRINANAIRSFLLSIILNYNTPIIFTKNSLDTAKFIDVLSKKKKREAPTNIKKKAKNTKEQMQFILESFPGIGPKTAKKLLKEFKSIKNIINASEKELEKTIGKKAKTMLGLIEVNG